jgi:hypothetical protein
MDNRMEKMDERMQRMDEKWERLFERLLLQDQHTKLKEIRKLEDERIKR